MNAWNSTLPARKAPMRRASPERQDARQCPSKPRKALPALGKRGKAWQAAWRELKPRLERAGITMCEVREPDDCEKEDCTPNFFLTPMHSLKRRNCTTPELLGEVVIACANCHNYWEGKKESEMCARVRGIIAARPIPV